MCRKFQLNKIRSLTIVCILVFILFSLHQLQERRAREKILSAVKTMSDFDLSVSPNKSTVLLEPKRNFNGDLNLCNEKNSGSRLFLLVMIISSPENFEQRERIRSTWNEVKNKWEIQLRNLTQINFIRAFQFLFFVGQSTNNQTNENLGLEWQRKGDLVIDDLQETYLTLTVKVLRMIKWTLANCGEAKHLVKMDDDVFLHVPKLVNYLRKKNSNSTSRLMLGHLHKNPRVIRDPFSKWFTPEEIYPESHFPTYTGGFCYIMTMQSANEIFQYIRDRNPPLFHMEDVFITGIIGNRILKIRLEQPGPTLQKISDDFENLRSVDWALRHVIIHEPLPEQFQCWTRFTVDDDDDVAKETVSNPIKECSL